MKTKKTQHTPTPWRYTFETETLISLRDANDYIVATSNSDEKVAAFIVRAVNAHEELVSALRCLYQNELGELRMIDEQVKGGLMLQVKNILARAEGKE